MWCCLDLRFKEAVEICCKVLRILKQPQGASLRLSHQVINHLGHCILQLDKDVFCIQFVGIIISAESYNMFAAFL